jgi:hypothetical protein
LAKALIKKLQLSLLDKIIDDFMENAEQRLLTYSPKKAIIVGNKLIDQLNNNSP